MRSRAAELEDGTKVFRSARDGKIYTEDGRALSDAQATAVNIDPLAPTLEQYEAVLREIEETRGCALIIM